MVFWRPKRDPYEVTVDRPHWFERWIIDPIQERSGGWFSLLPAVTWGGATFEAVDLPNDPHAQPLATYLREHHPLLYSEWFHRIYNGTRQVCELQVKLEHYKESREALFQQRNELVFRLHESFGEMRADFNVSSVSKEMEQYQIKSVIAYLLSPWLAPVLFHSMKELFARSLHPSDPIGFVVFPLLVGLAAAASIGAKIAVKTAVQNSRMSYMEEHQKRPSPVERIFQSPVLWTVLVLGAEIGFGAPFIVRYLALAVRDNPFWQVAIVLGSGLGPSINMAMAWALGREGARLSHLVAKEETRLSALYQESPYRRSIELSNSEIGQAKMQVNVLNARIRELERQQKTLSRRVRIDYAKWIRKVERILPSTPRAQQLLKEQLGGFHRDRYQGSSTGVWTDGSRGGS
ncbi:hypothetical protein NDI52_28610 [Leptolyngbya sp. PL-A3]|uniref:hypothetical protein n=1 Tax=Leptolyngbya sp. PL-A3 TaxID=2933911 RepID=UPI00329A2EB3